MRLDDPEAVLKDATRTRPVDGSMQVISPGDRDHSALMHRITATDPARRMPFRGDNVKFGTGPDPVLYLSNPDGFTPEDRRRFLDDQPACSYPCPT